jgi:putative endonuclease
MFYVYVLKSQKDRGLYIGFTKDLKKRVLEHNNGKNLSTKPRIPFELIFYEAYSNKYDALRREKYFKTGKGRTSLNLMLKETLSK